MKKGVYVPALAVLALLYVGTIKVQPATQDSKEKFVQAPQNVGNKACPVTCEKVDENGMPGATYEYKGKVYNFCCSGCVEEFKKDPEKYIKKVEEELKAKNPRSSESGKSSNESGKPVQR